MGHDLSNFGQVGKRAWPAKNPNDQPVPMQTSKTVLPALRHSVGACAIAIGLMSTLPAAATPVTFTAPGQTFGFNVKLDLNSLSTPSTVFAATMTFPFDNNGPFQTPSVKVYSGLNGTGNLLYAENSYLNIMNQGLGGPGIVDGEFSVYLTMTSDPTQLAQFNLGNQLNNGGIGADLTVTARMRPIDTMFASFNTAMTVTAVQEATVPEPQSLALALLALGATAMTTRRRAARPQRCASAA